MKGVWKIGIFWVQIRSSWEFPRRPGADRSPGAGDAWEIWCQWAPPGRERHLPRAYKGGLLFFPFQDDHFKINPDYWNESFPLFVSECASSQINLRAYKKWPWRNHHTIVVVVVMDQTWNIAEVCPQKFQFWFEVQIPFSCIWRFITGGWSGQWVAQGQIWLCRGVNTNVFFFAVFLCFSILTETAFFVVFFCSEFSISAGSLFGCWKKFLIF